MRRFTARWPERPAAALIVQPPSTTNNTIRRRCLNDNAALACDFNLVRNYI
jgi:hypothetical protein